jgi:hypothetical protein
MVGGRRGRSDHGHVVDSRVVAWRIVDCRARFQSAYQQSMPSVSSHKHGSHGQSFATIDAAGLNGPAATSATDKVGRKLDLTA